jgi:hypothetical protein
MLFVTASAEVHFANHAGQPFFSGRISVIAELIG